MPSDYKIPLGSEVANEGFNIVTPGELLFIHLFYLIFKN
jgi:hypothetical protein